MKKNVQQEENKESKGNEAYGKGEIAGKENINDVVTTSKKFALLEEGEKEIQKQIK